MGWCQFGRVALPDWRVTCFFVDKAQRGREVAFAALQGALGPMAAAGGGMVEGYPEEVAGRGTAAFLHSGTLAMSTRAGFEPERRVGNAKWVVRQVARGAV